MYSRLITVLPKACTTWASPELPTTATTATSSAGWKREARATSSTQSPSSSLSSSSPHHPPSSPSTPPSPRARPLTWPASPLAAHRPLKSSGSWATRRWWRAPSFWRGPPRMSQLVLFSASTPRKRTTEICTNALSGTGPSGKTPTNYKHQLRSTSTVSQ